MRTDGTVERVRLEWFPPLAFPSDPIELIRRIAENLRAVCEQGANQPVFAGTENGYPTAVRLVLCVPGGESERGEIVMIKAVRGESGYWLAARSRVIVPGDAERAGEGLPVPREVLARWSAFMRALRVCDPEDDAHPCAAEDASSLGAQAGSQ